MRYIKPENQWRIKSPTYIPIQQFLKKTDGSNLTLLDLGSGKGILSDLAKKQGFKVTSVDNGNTPYESTTRIDSQELEGYWDYIVGSGFPPYRIPLNVQSNYFIYTTEREDYYPRYSGILYKYKTVYIKTNIKNFDKHLEYPIL